MKKYYLVVTSVLIIFNCTMPPVNMVPNLGYYYNPKDRGFLFSKTQLIVSANTSYYQTKIYYSRGQSFQRGRFLQNQSLQLELYHPISVGMVIPTSISCYSIYPYVKYKMIKCDIKYITSVNPFLAIAPHSYHFREIPFSTGVNVAKINRKSGNAAGISLTPIFATAFLRKFLVEFARYS